jgi:hypothetical protein
MLSKILQLALGPHDLIQAEEEKLFKFTKFTQNGPMSKNLPLSENRLIW